MNSFENALLSENRIRMKANSSAKKDITMLNARMALDLGIDKDTISRVYKIPKSDF